MEDPCGVEIFWGKPGTNGSQRGKRKKQGSCFCHLQVGICSLRRLLLLDFQDGEIGLLGVWRLDEPT